MTIIIKNKTISTIYFCYFAISLILAPIAGLNYMANITENNNRVKAAQGISDIEFVSVTPDQDYYDWDYVNDKFYRFDVRIDDRFGGDIDNSDNVKFWIAPASDTDDTQVMENIQSGSYSHSSVNTWFGPGSYGGDTQVYYYGLNWWVFEIDASIMDDYLGTSLAFDCSVEDTATGDVEELSWEDRFYYVRVIEYSVILTEPDPGQYVNYIPFDVEWSHPQTYGVYYDDLDYFEVWLDSDSPPYTTTNEYYTFSSVSQGLHIAHVRAKSDDHGYGIEQTVSFEVDTIPPGPPTLISPSNGVYINDNTPYLDWNDVLDANNYELYLDDNPSFTSPFHDRTTNSYYTLSTLSDDTYYWMVRAQDAATNMGPFSGYWSFTLDTGLPTININTPNGNYYTSSPLMDVDFSDTVGLDDAYYKVDSYTPTGLDTTGWTSIFTSHSGTSYSTDFSLDSSIWNGLSEGSHTVYFKVWDDTGNINDGSTPSWQFYKDTGDPSIMINSPNGDYYNSAPTMDVDFSDTLGLDEAYYKVDSYTPTGLDTTGWTVIFTDNSGTGYSSDFAMDSSIWSGLSEGSHTVYFKVWDDSDNINDGSSPSWQFYKDTGSPSISINDLSGDYYASAPLMDVDFSDTLALDDAYYKVDSYTPTGLDTTGWVSIFINHAGTDFSTDFTMDSSVWDGLGDGTHTVYFKVWDNAGNINDGSSPSWQFYKDTGAPSITINTPNGEYYAAAPLMDVDFSDALSLDDAYYKVDSYTPTGLDTTGWIAIFTSHAGTSYSTDFSMDSSVWDGLGEGAHNVYFKVWDDAGNINDGSSPSWFFYKDTGGPSIIVNIVDGNYYSSAPILDVDFSDAVGLDDAYYKVDSYTPTGLDTTGWTSIFTSHSGTSYTTDFSLDSSIWNGLSEGSHIVYFKAWDDTAQITDGDTPSWQFYKDTETPSITINSPNGNYYNSAPTMDIDFSDTLSLDDAYYKVDSYTPTGFDTTGWTSIFTSHSGTSYTTDFAIDSSIWSGLSEGNHIVYFKVWDETENINDGDTPSWQFYKDTGTPSISINDPSGEYYSSAPLMDIDFSDTFTLDDAYYKVDSYTPIGLDTTGWMPIFTDHSGTSYSADFSMDSTVWDGLGDGAHTVYFKVWDDVENINDGDTPYWQFYKDTGAPSITINSPSGEYYSSIPLMNVDFFDTGGLDDAYYKLDSYTPTGLDTTDWISIFFSYAGTSYNFDFVMDSLVWEGLSEGIHTVYFKVWDDTENINDGDTPSWQFYKDTEAPSITINIPGGEYYSSAPLIDVDFFDNGGLDDAYYKVDSYTPTGFDTTDWIPIFIDHSGTSYATDFSLDSSLWDSLGEGSHVVYFKAWDDSGTLNDGDTPSLQFYKDAGVPIITVNSLNGEYYASVPLMDIDFSDTGGLDDAYYKVDSYTPTGFDTTGWIPIFTTIVGTSYTSDFSMDSSIWDGLTEGSHIVYFKVWDDTGQINDGSIPTWQFYKDTEAPIITIYNVDGEYYASAPMMDIGFFDFLGLDNAYYKVDSYTPTGLDTTGWTSVFIDHSGTSYSADFSMDSSVWDGLSAGSHIVYFKAWDDAENINDGNIPKWQFYKDTEDPSITINTLDGDYYASAPLMDIDFADNQNLSAAYYKIDSFSPTGTSTTDWQLIFIDSNDMSYSLNFNLDPIIWDTLSDGNHIVYFKAWDDAGNIIDGSSPSWQFYKDTSGPVISLNSPADRGVYQSNTEIDLSFLDELPISAILYRWDAALDFEIYDDFNPITLLTSEGQHNLEIWANDSLGNVNSEIFSFITDDTPPTATFQGISNASVLSGLVTFNVNPYDLNGIKEISLNLDNIHIEAQTSNFAFNFDTKNYNDGNYTIRFLVVDNANNILEKAFSIRIKNVDFPMIPGYNIGVFIVNILFILSIIILFRKKKLDHN